MYRLPNVLFAFVLTIILAGCNTSTTSSTADFPAPAFQLTSLENESLSLEELKGEVTVIHFGTSWCPFCRVEDPHLEALFQLYKEKNVRVLVINVGEEDDVASKWKKEAGFSFPMLMDRNGEVAASYAPADAQPALPRHEVMIASNLIIDSTGRVRFMSLLDTNNFDAELVALRTKLDLILKEGYTSS